MGAGDTIRSIPSVAAAEGERHCPGARGEGAGNDRVRRAVERGGVQRQVQGTRPNDAEASAVAPAGEPARITGVEFGAPSLNGMPAGAPGVRI